MKKILLILLFPLLAFSQEGLVTSGNNGTFAWITGIVGSPSYPVDLTIPDTIGGLPVRNINAYAFSAKTSLRTVTFGANVTNTGGNSFEECTNVSSVVFNNGLVSIGDYAFRYNRRLTNLIIPDSVTKLGKYSFAVCPSITNIVVGSGVTDIPPAAFYLIISARSITVPNSITNFGEYAFAECYYLPEFSPPSSLKTVKDNAFENCHSLSNLTFGTNLTSLSTAFRSCHSLTNITFYGDNPLQCVTNIGLGTTNQTKFMILASKNWPDLATNTESVTPYDYRPQTRYFNNPAIYGRDDWMTAGGISAKKIKGIGN